MSIGADCLADWCRLLGRAVCDNVAGMRYLITGGAGFVGSHLAEALLQRDHEVIVIDDLSTGTIRNIRHLADNPRFPFREEGDLVLGPSSKGRWSYACSKLIDEFLAIAYHRERGLPTVVGRLFNTVGPRQTGQYGMVVPTFVRQALAGQPVTVFGDGLQSRCFTHVSDAVRALIGIMERPEAYGQVYNIGNTEEVTILDLAQRVIARSGSKSAIEFVPYERAYQPGFEDMNRRVPDVSRIGQLIGWQPTFQLDQILQDVIDWCRQSAA